MQEEMQETEVRETISNSGDSTVKKQRVSHTEYTPGVVIAQRVIWFVAGLFSVYCTKVYILIAWRKPRRMVHRPSLRTKYAPSITIPWYIWSANLRRRGV